MCPECDGLGTKFTFDPDLLIPDTSLSFYEGAIPIVGPLRGMGRWRKHIYEGVAKTFSIDLKKPWDSLPEEQQHILLQGTGDRTILTNGNSVTAFGGMAGNGKESFRNF